MHAIAKLKPLDAVEPSSHQRKIRAQIWLGCGCEVVRRIASDRVMVMEDGSFLGLGKMSCPNGHPVGHRPLAGHPSRDMEHG